MHELLIAATKHNLRAVVRYGSLDGVHGTVDDSTRTVWVSVTLTPAEERSTIMHELAHLALGSYPNGDPVHDRAIENLCDEWAAARLITDAELAYAMHLAKDPREIEEILRVDTDILNARLRLAGLPEVGQAHWSEAVGQAG